MNKIDILMATYNGAIYYTTGSVPAKSNFCKLEIIYS